MRDCTALSLMSKPHPEPLRNSSLPVISVLPAVLFFCCGCMMAVLNMTVTVIPFTNIRDTM